jgi:hypothetical protein
MSTHRNPFYRVSTLVTASDLQQPLASSVESKANAFDAYCDLSGDLEAFDRMSLVFDDDKVVGWWWPHDGALTDDSDDTVGLLMSSIPLSMIVAANTSFFELADMFARRSRPFVFVVDGTDLTGTVSYLDLFSRIGQLCILALTFHLESSAEELCTLQPQQCWSALSPARKKFAEAVLERRHRSVSGTNEAFEKYRLLQLVRCTTFADKATMIAKAHLVPAISNTELKSVFAFAERIRNLCAHGADEQELSLAMPQSNFARFLHRTQDTIETIRIAVRTLKDS